MGLEQVSELRLLRLGGTYANGLKSVLNISKNGGFLLDFGSFEWFELGQTWWSFWPGLLGALGLFGYWSTIAFPFACVALGFRPPCAAFPAFRART